jgi:MarR family transcriptional regulator, transcriptional regulator for hemolysin
MSNEFEYDAGSYVGSEQRRENCEVTDSVRCLGFYLLDAGRLYRHHFQTRSQDLALDLTQCRVLLTLAQHENLTQQRLAKLIGIHPAALGRLLDRLDAQGWVERQPRPGDRRARLLVLTQEARAMLPRIGRIATESQLAALAGLSQHETQLLARALERVRKNL